MQLNDFAALAQQYSKTLFPSVTLAQLILESGWAPGKSLSTLATRYHNLFGIKAGSAWTGKTIELNTLEDDGQGNLYPIVGRFRWYDSYAEAFQDHDALFTSTPFLTRYYQKVRDAQTPEAQCQALQGTYATDTRYAAKLMRLINQYNLIQYDSLKEDTSMTATDRLIHWFTSRLGKVTYSMQNRQGPNSYDCSSAVYSALIYAGYLPQGTPLGNTETLYQLEGTLLTPIHESQIQRGDLFISGFKGASTGAAGHTGVVLSPEEIIHCTYSKNGIAKTPRRGWTGQPVHYYRLKRFETIAPAQAQSTKASTYTVQAGDYLGKIAQEHGVTVADLYEWNQLTSDLIHPGQELRVLKPTANSVTEAKPVALATFSLDNKTYHIIQAS